MGSDGALAESLGGFQSSPALFETRRQNSRPRPIMPPASGGGRARHVCFIKCKSSSRDRRTPLSDQFQPGTSGPQAPAPVRRSSPSKPRRLPIRRCLRTSDDAAAVARHDRTRRLAMRAHRPRRGATPLAGGAEAVAPIFSRYFNGSPRRRWQPKTRGTLGDQFVDSWPGATPPLRRPFRCSAANIAGYGPRKRSPSAERCHFGAFL